MFPGDSADKKKMQIRISGAADWDCCPFCGWHFLSGQGNLQPIYLFQLLMGGIKMGKKLASFCFGVLSPFLPYLMA